MSRRAPILVALFALLAARAAFAQYGDIGDVKLNKPEDKQDVKSTPPPEGAVVLFDGKNLDQWVRRDEAVAAGKGEGKPAEWKLLDGGAVEVAPGKGDIMSKQSFAGHFKLHVEFRVPYKPEAKGQARGNSGVYLQGRYEIQVLDSYGLKEDSHDCGGVYGVATPSENACKAPTVWQSYDIDFTAAKYEDGKKIEPARVTVVQNGVKIHDDVKIPVDRTTSAMNTDPATPGPIMLQDHGNPVQYRNVWVVKE